MTAFPRYGKVQGARTSPRGSSAGRVGIDWRRSVARASKLLEKGWSRSPHLCKPAIGRTGQDLVRRQMNVQPTLTIRPGFQLRVIVTRDIVMAPVGDAK